MPWILGAARWIMLVSGLLTCTLLYAAILAAANFGLAAEHEPAQ
jgi:hypothetical protein